MKLSETVEFNFMNMHESSSALDGFKLPTEDLHAVPLLPAGVRVPIEARVPTPLKREREKRSAVRSFFLFFVFPTTFLDTTLFLGSRVKAYQLYPPFPLPQ